jgi:integrase
VLTKARRGAIVKAANDALRDALAPSTWSGLESCWRRLLEFRLDWGLASGQNLTVPEAVVLWIAFKQQSGAIICSSALQYVQNLKSAAKRFGEDISQNQLVMDFERALLRRGAKRPTKQAKPATLSDVQEILANANIDILVRLGVAMAWGGAARCSDVIGLRAGDVRWDGEDGFCVTWVRTKSDPFRLGRTTGLVLMPRFAKLLREMITSRLPVQPLIPDLDYPKMNAAMKGLKTGLTGHSLRRGALTYLLNQGVPIMEIMTMSRHGTVDGLVRYVDAGKIPLARETRGMSAKLL